MLIDYLLSGFALSLSQVEGCDPRCNPLPEISFSEDRINTPVVRMVIDLAVASRTATVTIRREQGILVSFSTQEQPEPLEVKLSEMQYPDIELGTIHIGRNNSGWQLSASFGEGNACYANYDGRPKVVVNFQDNGATAVQTNTFPCLRSR